MDTIIESFNRAISELLGRSSGPLHLRLLIQPTVASILAIKAGLRDAKEGNPPFLWNYVTESTQRAALRSSVWKDIGKLFIIATVLDLVYQYIVLKEFHLLQTLIVAVVVAVIPYCLVRGPVTRLMGRKGR